MISYSTGKGVVGALLMRTCSSTEFPFPVLHIKVSGGRGSKTISTNWKSKFLNSNHDFRGGEPKPLLFASTGSFHGQWSQNAGWLLL